MKEESPIVFISCLGLRETTADQSQKVDKGISIDKERCQYIKKCLHIASTGSGAPSNLSSWPVARVPRQGNSTPDQGRGWVRNGVTLRDGHK